MLTVRVILLPSIRGEKEEKEFEWEEQEEEDDDDDEVGEDTGVDRAAELAAGSRNLPCTTWALASDTAEAARS